MYPRPWASHKYMYINSGIHVRMYMQVCQLQTQSTLIFLEQCQNSLFVKGPIEAHTCTHSSNVWISH